MTKQWTEEGKLAMENWIREHHINGELLYDYEEYIQYWLGELMTAASGSIMASLSSTDYEETLHMENEWLEDSPTLTQYRVGDKVKLNSGGPQLTVTKVDGEPTGYVECKWVTQRGLEYVDQFNIVCLSHVKEEPPSPPMATLPFNLEDAKAGAKVCTRAGRPARIICWDMISFGGLYPIGALIAFDVEEYFMEYTIRGTEFNAADDNSDDDLMMVNVKPASPTVTAQKPSSKRMNLDEFVGAIRDKFLDTNLMASHNARKAMESQVTDTRIGIRDEVEPALKSKRISEW